MTKAVFSRNKSCDHRRGWDKNEYERLQEGRFARWECGEVVNLGTSGGWKREREGAEGGISGGTWERSDKTEKRGETGGLRLCCSQGRSGGYFKACSLVSGVGKFTNNDSR